MEITRVRVSNQYPYRSARISESCPATMDSSSRRSNQRDPPSHPSPEYSRPLQVNYRILPAPPSSLGGAGAATAEGKLNSGFGLPNFDSSTKFQRSRPRPWRQFRLLEPAPPPMETAHKLCPSRVYGQSSLRPRCRKIWGLATPVSAPPPNFGGAGIVLGSYQRSLCRHLHRILGEPVSSLASFDTH